MRRAVSNPRSAWISRSSRSSSVATSSLRLVKRPVMPSDSREDVFVRPARSRPNQPPPAPGAAARASPLRHRADPAQVVAAGATCRSGGSGSFSATASGCERAASSCGDLRAPAAPARPPPTRLLRLRRFLAGRNSRPRRPRPLLPGSLTRSPRRQAPVVVPGDEARARTRPGLCSQARPRRNGACGRRGRSRSGSRSPCPAGSPGNERAPAPLSASAAPLAL